MMTTNKRSYDRGKILRSVRSQTCGFAFFLLLALTGCGTLLGEGPGGSNAGGPCTALTAQKLDSDITAPTTLKGCLVVTGKYQIKAAVTVEAGSLIFFAEGAGLEVSKEGSLQAVGTKDKVIQFQGQVAATGSWQGLLFGSKNAKNQLVYTQIRHAGSEDPLYLQKTAIGLYENASLRVQHTLIAESGGSALEAQVGASLSAFSQNTIEKNAATLRIPPALMAVFDGSNQFKDNTKNKIIVYGTELKTSINIRAIAIPYLIEKKLEAKADIQVQPGVIIHFAQGAALTVTKEGSLKAIGTADKAIVFEGQEAGKGYWMGLAFDSKKKANILKYVQVRGGGSDAFLFMEPANLVVYDNGALNIGESTIQGSAGYGLYVIGSAMTADLQFANNTFKDNDKAPVHLPAQLMGQLDPGSDYAQSQAAYISVDGSKAITKDLTLQALSVPYRIISTIELEAAMSISPGSTVTFAQGKGLNVKEAGSLRAVGTKDQRIVFEGAEATSGYWMGLVFASKSPNNQLRYVDISHGGSSAYVLLEAANLGVYSKARVLLDQVGLSDSGGWGIYAEKGATLQIKGCIYKRNQKGENNQEEKP